MQASDESMINKCVIKLAILSMSMCSCLSVLHVRVLLCTLYAPQALPVADRCKLSCMKDLQSFTLVLSVCLSKAKGSHSNAAALQLACEAAEDVLGAAGVAAAKQIRVVQVVVQGVDLMPLLETCIM